MTTVNFGFNFVLEGFSKVSPGGFRFLRQSYG